MAAGDLLEGTGGRPWRRFGLRAFEMARHRRHIDYRRTAVVLLAGLAIVSALVYLGSRATRDALAWLALQTPYQVPFDQIELISEPPRWYRGGSRAFVEAVRRSAGLPEHVAVLEFAPERLKMEFQKYAWVKEVTRVAYAPGRIQVDIRYRQPVAWMQLGGTEQIVIDERAVILSQEDIDMASLGRVIRVTGHGLASPSDPRPGLTWKSRSEGDEVDRVDERVTAAATLAAFLVKAPQVRDAEGSPALTILEIIVTDFSLRGLFAINAEGAAFWWRGAPGAEGPDEPVALKKWSMMRDWAATTRDRFLETGDYWAFSAEQVYHVCPRRHRPASHRPKLHGKSSSEPPVAETNSSQSG
jgi:hypothetical protein